MPNEAEYLQRPLIEGVAYEISETRIAIQSPNSCIISCVLPKRCQKAEMLSRYQKVLQKSKKQGIRISYSLHIRRVIQEQWPTYIAGREKQERLFRELRETVTVVQQRGIRLGYRDDEKLAKAYEIEGQLDELRYSDKAVRQIAEFDHELWMLEDALSREQSHYNMISL